MMLFSVRSLCGAVAALSVSSCADAAIMGHQWVEVNNALLPGTGAASGLADGSLDGTIYRTFDLFITSDVPVTVLDSGVTQTSGPNAGLSISGTSFFQRAPTGGGGGVLPPEASAIASDPLLQFDSFVGVGGRSAASILVAGAITFSDTGLRGTWATMPGSGPEAPNANGRIFFGRFTVSSVLGFGSDESAARRLSGRVFAFPQGATAGVTIDVGNAFAIPAPGSALLGGVMVWAARRRRW